MLVMVILEFVGVGGVQAGARAGAQGADGVITGGRTAKDLSLASSGHGGRALARICVLDSLGPCSPEVTRECYSPVGGTK